MPNIVELIQEIVKNTNNASALTNVMFGTVTNTAPLKILVEQKLELSEEFLILTKNVKDYNVDVTVNWFTENTTLNANHAHTTNVNSNISVSSEISPNDNNQKITNAVDKDISVSVEEKSIDLTHKHKVSGRKIMTVHNALSKGDKVILIQQEGGQKFVVLDKV